MIKIMDKNKLKGINFNGKKRGYTQLLSKDFLDNLKEKFFPIIESFETEVFETKEKIQRCLVVVNDEGLTVNLDMSKNQYNHLPNLNL